MKRRKKSFSRKTQLAPNHMPRPIFPKKKKGLANILEKGRKFGSMIGEMHEITLRDLVVTGNVIAFVMGMDATMKGKERGKWEELCVYVVKDGKIVSEQFFM